MKRCSNKECCKQCRYVMFKGTESRAISKKKHSSISVITLVLLLPLLAVTTLPLVSEAGAPRLHNRLQDVAGFFVHNLAPNTVLAPEAAMEGPPPPPAHASPVASSAISVETAHMSEPPVLPPLPEISLPRPGSDDTECVFFYCVSDSASLDCPTALSKLKPKFLY